MKRGAGRLAGWIIWLVGAGLLSAVPGGIAGEGVTDEQIVLGTVLDLEGRSQGLGQGMLQGMQAALEGQSVGARRIVLLSANDSYTPTRTVEATRRLMAQGVFLFAGNVGTPTAAVSLPLLASAGIPAVGFFSGAGLLRPGEGDILNFRASYAQETAAVIRKVLGFGVDPLQVCAFVQNDAYGMAGIQGLREALQDEEGMALPLKALRDMLAMEGDDPERNNIGPVGVYTRNTFTARSGYDSLKHWEQQSGKPCRLVVTVGTYEAVGRFIAYARGKGERWLFSAVSFTGADNLLDTLNRFGIEDRVVMTEVTPSAVDSALPIVQEARTALGEQLGQVSLEGYIVGRMVLYGLQSVAEQGLPMERQNFLKVFRGRRFLLGGLPMDFQDDNQGSDFVAVTLLSKGRWVPATDPVWKGWLE